MSIPFLRFFKEMFVRVFSCSAGGSSTCSPKRQSILNEKKRKCRVL